jgi:SAM-dependent methyltransferase
MDRGFYDRYFELEGRHWWFVGRRRIIREEVERSLRALAPPPSGTPSLLDIGCGTGAMLVELAQFGHVQGTERERAAAEYARQRSFADVSVAGSPPLPFETGSFDLVTILDVLEHIDDDVAMVAEIRRLLRPGGRMVATVPAFPGLWGRQDEISHHERRYVRSTLSESVERSGLRLERLTYFNTALFVPIATVRLLRRLRPDHGELSSDFEMTTPGIINEALGRVFSLEASWLASRNLPFGVSLMAVAERPPGDEPERDYARTS